MEIGNSVRSVTLADIIYEHDWNVPSLRSWRKIDMLGGFRIVGEDSIITVQRICDHSSVIIAELMHECYQVQPLTRHNKIYTAATDFWHQAL